MLLRQRGTILDILLKECYTRRHCQNPVHRRTFASEAISPTEVKNVAVLGGGITGLASAFYLSEAFPKSNITLYEGSPRLGGWLHSTSVDVGNGQVVFEQGPRNLRPSVPNGMVTLDLIQRLNLQGEVLMTSKNSVAAQNRFLYYPDHLVRMPGPGLSILQQISMLFTEPVFKGLVPAVLGEPIRERRSSDLPDESIGSFLSRRFGPELADNIVSAVLHGIYAGDVYQLSARSLLPLLWRYELVTESGSVTVVALKAYLEGHKHILVHDLNLLRNLRPRMLSEDGKPLPGMESFADIRKSSIFTFKKGIGELATRLEHVLEARPNVKIRRNTRATSLHLVTVTNSNKIRLKSASGKTRQSPLAEKEFDHVISTLSGKTLSALAPGRLDVLSQTPSVTVMVVNLFYSNPSLLPVHGFGYLLPRSVPFLQNPERALGVVFDSDATIGQDNVPGTKVTVMLGGHWWDGWDVYPDEEEGANMAKSILARHLNIHEEPQAVRVGLQKDCIPQYTVGHFQRMETAREDLEKHFHGRLRVAGNSYTGVGLNDCVRSARDVVDGLVSGKGKTGLDTFRQGDMWRRVPKELQISW